MKCFYHNDRNAVAQCQRCGKGLCHECASAHMPVMCETCYEEVQAEQAEAAHQEREACKADLISLLKSRRKRFVQNCIYGAVCAAIMLILLLVSGVTNLVELLFYTGVFFMIPFGWSFLSRYQTRWFIFMGNDAWFYYLIGILVKSLFSFVSGTFIFVWQLYHYIDDKKKLRQLETA